MSERFNSITPKGTSPAEERLEELTNDVSRVLQDRDDGLKVEEAKQKAEKILASLGLFERLGRRVRELIGIQDLESEAT